MLGFTINLSVYVTVLRLSDSSSENIRFSYRQTESVNEPGELLHPVVRAVLTERGMGSPINISTMADVPAGTGLGSSSAFTVGLLAALDSFGSNSRSAEDLAEDAIRIERVVLGEAGGWQDQFQSAVGGFRLYNFGADGASFLPSLPKQVVKTFDDWFLLVSSGNARASHQQQLNLVARLNSKGGGSDNSFTSRQLDKSVLLARKTYAQLKRASPGREAAEILANAVDQGWLLKKASGADPGLADHDIAIAKGAGALAGKLCGAGLGGFLFLIVPPEKREQVHEVFHDRAVHDIMVRQSGVRVERF